jgi:hypothetical protein
MHRITVLRRCGPFAGTAPRFPQRLSRSLLGGGAVIKR